MILPNGKYLLSQDERNALKSLFRGIPLDKGRNWLLNVQIDDSKGCGWPHLTAQDRPQVWGGTLDGIRGLIATGLSRYDPHVSRAIDWLLEQQDDSGGFGTREMAYPASEPTAWVLITLKEVGLDPSSEPKITKAVSFLESCVNTEGFAATSPIDEPRTYPTILTLWALHGWSSIALNIARAIKDMRDAQSGGWGIKAGITTNVVSTCQAIFVLLQTSYLDKNDVITRQAVEYIVTQQNSNGSWNNFSETWYSQNQPNIPLRCDEYVTAWAVRALLAAGLSSTSKPVASAVSWLIYQQQPDGYWLFDPLDDAKHIWCAAGSIRALALAREKLLLELTDTGIAFLENENSSEATLTEKVLIDPKKIISYIRANVSNALLVLLTLYVFREQIEDGIQKVGSFLNVQADSLISNLLASLIWFVLFLLGTVLLRYFRSEKN